MAEFSKQYCELHDSEMSHDFDIIEIADGLEPEHYTPIICEGFGFIAIGKNENNEAILGINIVSLDGKIMKQITDLNGSTVYTIHVDDLQNGLYVLEIVGASSTHNTRIIKQD